VALVFETLADLLERLGNVPLERVRVHPAPGTATEADVLARPAGQKHICELVDGVLVEKAMGYYESLLAALLIGFLRRYLEEHDLGIVLGEAGPLRLAPGLVRIPDVSFIAWERFPDRRLPAEPMPDLAPDLAVEILSPGNTGREMERKRAEYFAAGTRLVWIVSPGDRTVQVYTSPADVRLLGEDAILDASPVLPGFRLPIRDWFGAAPPRRSS
jgi:Uma2 family endonuclease